MRRGQQPPARRVALLLDRRAEQRGRSGARRRAGPASGSSNCDHSSPRWFSIGVPVRHRRWPRLEPAGELGGLAGRVLDRLRLVEHDQVPLARAAAPRRRAAAARRWSAPGRPRGSRRRAAARSGPCSGSTRRLGREALGLALASWRPGWSGRRPGPARRAGRPAFSARMWARVWMVLPSPMSSASMPPSPCPARNCSQARPVALVGAQLGQEALWRRPRSTTAPAPRSRSTSSRSRLPPSQRRRVASAMAARASGLAQRDVEAPVLAQRVGIVELDQRLQHRPQALHRQSEHAAVRQGCVEGLALQDVPAPGRGPEPCNRLGQDRQQSHPLALDLDPELEREPPATAVVEAGLPVAAGLDDTMAELGRQLDAPALGAQQRQVAMDEAVPGGGVVPRHRQHDRPDRIRRARQRPGRPRGRDRPAAAGTPAPHARRGGGSRSARP